MKKNDVDIYLKEKKEMERKIIYLKNKLSELQQKYFDKYLKEGDL